MGKISLLNWGLPDVWAGGGIGLIAGLLLRYVLVRVLVVF